MIYNSNKINDINYKKQYNIHKIDYSCNEYKLHMSNYKIMQSKLINKFVNNINEDFITKIINDDKNIMINHSIDDSYDIDSISSFIIYRKIIGKNDIKYVILLFAVHPNIRNAGYGNLILDEFIKKISMSKSLKKINIILHSLESSLNFYLNYGFIKDNHSKFLNNYEGIVNNVLQYTISEKI